jgi:hypothetical protein
MAQANYCREAKNPNPIFEAPAHHKERPSVIRRWQSWTAEKELHNWTGFLFLRVSGRRQNKIRPDRQKALAAVVQAMLHHLNLVTHQVEASVEQIADECGLSTVSKANNKSITRVSNLFNDLLEPLDCIETVKVWDKNADCWIPKYIEVKPRFFEMLGLDYTHVEKEQARRQIYAQSRLITNSEAGLLSISELKKLSKQAHIANAFAIRRNKMVEAKKKRLAHKLEVAADKHGYSELDNDVALVILSEMNTAEKAVLKPSQLKELVNRRKARYRALIAPSPQKH